MGSRKWRQREYFKGPTYFGSAANPVDTTWYGDTTSSVAVWDASADELYLDGADLWLKDDDQLEFGDASDVVVDWDNANSQWLFAAAAAGQKHTFGTSSLYWDADWNMRAVDIDLYGAYGASPGFNINRNLTSGATDAAVVLIKQDHASDDQPALKLQQDASLVPALEVDGWSRLGWSTSDPSGAVTAGSVRVISANSSYWLAVATGNSTYRYVQLTLTSTA